MVAHVCADGTLKAHCWHLPLPTGVHYWPKVTEAPPVFLSLDCCMLFLCVQRVALLFTFVWGDINAVRRTI